MVQEKEDHAIANFASEIEEVVFKNDYVIAIDDNFIKMAPVALVNKVTIVHKMMPV